MAKSEDDDASRRPHCNTIRLLVPLCLLVVLSLLHTQRETVFLLTASSQTTSSSSQPVHSIMIATATNTTTASSELPFVSRKDTSEIERRRNDFSSACCGRSWDAFVKDNGCLSSASFPLNHPILWTVSGGDEYRSYLPMLLENWERRVLYHESQLLVLALDAATVDVACSHGFMAVHWDAPAQSYSRVADAKFQVAAKWSAMGHHQLFVELDVFCRDNPLPLLLHEASEADLVLMGHGDLQQKVNIGMYYVKPSDNNIDLFTTVSRLLAPSLNATKMFRGIDNELHEYFDQEVFHNCLGVPNDRTAVMYDPEKNSSADALLPCHAIQVQYRILSNLYLSSYRPPIVHDTTVCIHPLDIRPFTSIRTKVATAKFYGFDPAIHPPDQRILKTASGDLTYSEDWNTGFFMEEFTQRDIQYQYLQRPMALLIALAQASQRTLVLPRNIRDKAGKAYPVFSLVSTASIERMGVSWKFGPTHPTDSLVQRPGEVVEFSTTLTLVDTLQNITESCLHRTTCSVHGLYRHSVYPPNDEHDLLDGIIRNLTWCLSPPDFRDSFPFAHGFGSHEWACP